MSEHQPGRVHQTLRQATAEAHHVLDHHRLMQRLTGRELTREQYAESLAAMHRPHAWLERVVLESPHHFNSGLGLAPRLTLLEADLYELGWSAPSVQQSLPDAFSDHRAAWWGRVYVLEGSRRGSAIIARCIHASLRDIVPCRFFSESMPAKDQSKLMARLEQELEQHKDLVQAVASAREAFAVYTSHLDAFDGEKSEMDWISLKAHQRQ